MLPDHGRRRGADGRAASIRHIKIGNIDLGIVIGLTIGGIPAVFVAAFLVVTCRWSCCAGW